MEVYPERQKRQKTRFVCNFNGKSVFRCTQHAITQRCVITLGSIFIKMVLNRAQCLKKKSQEVSARKNNNRQRYNKKCRRGAVLAPPALLGLKANKTLWFLRRNLWRCPVAVTQQRYFALVRRLPEHVEYLSSVWDLIQQVVFTW